MLLGSQSPPPSSAPTAQCVSSSLTSLPFLHFSHSDLPISVIRTLVITWGHLGHPGAFPHLKVLNLATPASSLFSRKGILFTYIYLQIQGQDVDIFEEPFFSCLNLSKG